MNPTISIVLTTYNGAKYLTKQLESLKNQTLQPTEIIVQDDCSNDNTVEIIQNYSQLPQIQLYQNEKNMGFVKNFESAIQKASGDYIALCDQDDIWESTKLQTLLNAIKDNTLAYSNSVLIDAADNSLGITLSQKLKNNFIDSCSALNFIFDNCVSAHAMIFHRSLLEHIATIPKNSFFDAYIAASAASLKGVKYVNSPLVLYRQHENNTLSQQKKSKCSIKEKILQKLEKKSRQNQEILSTVKDFLTISTLSEDEKALLQTLQHFLEDFPKRYFNFKMFLFLYANKELFFAITTRSKFALSFKRAIGYKLYKVVPFL